MASTTYQRLDHGFSSSSLHIRSKSSSSLGRPRLSVVDERGRILCLTIFQVSDRIQRVEKGRTCQAVPLILQAQLPSRPVPNCARVVRFDRRVLWVTCLDQRSGPGNHLHHRLRPRLRNHLSRHNHRGRPRRHLLGQILDVMRWVQVCWSCLKRRNPMKRLWHEGTWCRDIAWPV